MLLNPLRTRAFGFRESRLEDVGSAHVESSSQPFSMTLRDLARQRSRETVSASLRDFMTRVALPAGILSWNECAVLG